MTKIHCAFEGTNIYTVQSWAEPQYFFSTIFVTVITLETVLLNILVTFLNKLERAKTENFQRFSVKSIK